MKIYNIFLVVLLLQFIFLTNYFSYVNNIVLSIIFFALSLIFLLTLVIHNRKA